MPRRRRDRGARRRARAVLERLESRTVLDAATGPILSEFLASNGDGLRDADGEHSDWIEISNPTVAAVDLGGWSLTDDADEPGKWTLPGVVLDPGRFLVVFASDKDRDAPGGELHTNFKLGAEGEYLGLIRPDGTVAHEFAPAFPPQEEDVSFGVAFDGATPDLGRVASFAAPSPGAPNSGESTGVVEAVSFSVPHGFYDAPISVALSTPTAGATIRYTLDGSEPTADRGRIYSGPLTVDRTTILRAGAFKEGDLARPTVAQTYIFLDDVIRQSPEGQTPPGWPATWGGHVVDLGMDPAIVGHPEYGGEALKAALKAIPTFSLTTDLAHLFDPATGIYANSLESGREWERPASVELINPDGSPGFQVGAGVRIRGSGSAAPTNPKHSLRLFFRDEYGAPTLDYPLFGDEGVDSFEKVDLRTAQNRSWSLEGEPDSNFVAEVFARDTTRDMGQPYTRSRPYHLYINGQYWGLYQTEERPSKEYAESYFGGDDDDYDVVKPESTTREIEATDGELDAWNRLWQAATAPGGLSSADAYSRLQGRNPDGSDDPDSEVLLDVDNLIDYMITILYTGNIDGPISGNPEAGLFINNFYAIRNRDPGARQGFQFIMRDAEFSLLDPAEDRNGPFDLGSEFPEFNPQYLHQLLLENPDYRRQFAEHARRYLAEGGLLSPEASIARFRDRALEIDRAVLAESARWGDARRPDDPLAPDDWLTAVDRVVSRYFPTRTDVVVDQLRGRGLLSPPGPTIGTPRDDYDGDGIADLALFRQGEVQGTFLASLSGGGDLARSFGGPGDIPVAGDFDGDRIADLAVFRPESTRMPGASEWFILGSRGGAVSVLFGGSGLDLPAPADYTGDGVTDIAVFRPASDLLAGAAHWFILPSEGGPAFDVLFGGSGLDLPAPADYDGDGRADIATYRTTTSEWFLLRTTAGALSTTFGTPGDVPAPADRDGDGDADLTVFRPSDARWIVRPTGGGAELATTFGGVGDVPVRAPLADRDPRAGSIAAIPDEADPGGDPAAAIGVGRRVAAGPLDLGRQAARLGRTIGVPGRAISAAAADRPSRPPTGDDRDDGGLAPRPAAVARRVADLHTLLAGLRIRLDGRRDG